MSEPSRIIVGDVLDGLRSLDSGSVHCCVTSPPYWGLRDYGTSSWEGGDAACDHKSQPRGSTMIRGSANKKTGPNQTEPFGAQYRGTCGKCGAVRVDSQIGLEKTPEEFVAKMVEVFREVRRVLRDDGTLWLNLGDSYASTTKGSGGEGSSTLVGTPAEGNGQRFAARKLDIGTLKPKDLCMIPWRVALALQADGWWLRSVICWAKKSPMPESVTDRPTSSWEPIFLLAKSDRYFYDAEAVKEPRSDSNVSRFAALEDADVSLSSVASKNTDKAKSPNNPYAKQSDGVRGIPGVGTTWITPIDGRNQRNVWHLGPEPYAEAHFATFPTEIPRRAIKAGTSEKGCCAACGGPWRRVVERTSIKRERPNDYTKRDGEDGTGNSCANSVAGVDVRTLGWEPTCTCGAAVVPCVVLEPFLGSGTSIAVARELGRHGVGIELNPEYAKLARDRIGKAERPATFRSDRVGPEGAGLFAREEA